MKIAPGGYTQGMNKIRSITVITMDGKTITLSGDSFNLILESMLKQSQDQAVAAITTVLFGAAQGDVPTDAGG